jgi:hypothetical protein
MIIRHRKKEFSTRVKRQRLNPTIMTDLSKTQFIKKWTQSKKWERRTNVHKHWPRSASQSLIVLSREAVMTKDIPNESTFNDCALAGCKGESEKRINLAVFKGSNFYCYQSNQFSNRWD